jgi:hypothetical protein
MDPPLASSVHSTFSTSSYSSAVDSMASPSSTSASNNMAISPLSSSANSYNAIDLTSPLLYPTSSNSTSSSSSSSLLSQPPQSQNETYKDPTHSLLSALGLTNPSLSSFPASSSSWETLLRGSLTLFVMPFLQGLSHGENTTNSTPHYIDPSPQQPPSPYILFTYIRVFIDLYANWNVGVGDGAARLFVGRWIWPQGVASPKNTLFSDSPSSHSESETRSSWTDWFKKAIGFK